MRMAMNTYLTVVIGVIDQKTSDRMPSTAARCMRQTALAVEERLHGVQRRGTDVAVYHAKRHDGHGRRDFVRAGLETAPPAADAALAGGLVKFRGFLLLRLVLP